MPDLAKTPPRLPKRPVTLTAPGWTPQARQSLQSWIQAGAGQSLPVAFDFDNTLVCGDIGEATLAMLVRNRLLKPGALPATLAPRFRSPQGKEVTPDNPPDLTAYYEAFLTPTSHGEADPAPLANGYVWAVECMQGLPLREVVQATREVYALAQPGRIRHLEVTPRQTAYPIPFFYPEMIELVARLLEYRFDVWIISASNVWSVRSMILHGLNPLLQQLGAPNLIPPDHIVGVATLLTDSRRQLSKDSVLVRQDPAYARLVTSALQPFTLTSRLQFPVPVYSGKVASLWDTIGRRPYLAVGDSPGDHAMLRFAEHRLWIARLEKPAYQQATRSLWKESGGTSWVVQPTLTQTQPGFVADPAGLPSDLLSPAVRQSLNLIRDPGA